jgi:ribosomal protein RSM22 (predicted rRNA methylase)
MSVLPDDLRSALAMLTEGLSRHELAERSRAISENYRTGGTSTPIADARDALAYALARMPATFAAVSACLAALREARPAFHPTSMIDAGAGPGTATWAAVDAFASLSELALLDANPALTDLARTLMAGNERLAVAGFRTGGVAQLLANAPGADLVVASYLIGELDERGRNALGPLLWERTLDTLLIVEPGTPVGYARVIEMGAHVLAPCPHDKACPLTAPDWCHFAQRLSRTRDHMLMKDAEVPFEDEKYVYAVLSRTPAELRPSRVLAPPRIGKAAIEAKLCTSDGVIAAGIARRDKAAYAKARRWRWGDAVAEPAEVVTESRTPSSRR